jgi:Ribbon-helix-helix protein, copG family
MPSTTLTVRIDEAAKQRLEKLAESTGRSRSFLAADAINQYLKLTSGKLPASSKRLHLSIAVKRLPMSRLKIGWRRGAVVVNGRSPGGDDCGLVT